MVEDLRVRIVSCYELEPKAFAINIHGTPNFKVLKALFDGEWKQVTSSNLVDRGKEPSRESVK